MERLTERSLDYCTQLCSDEDAISCAFYKGEQEEKCWRANMYDRLAYYEDLEEQGRLVVLPCKVGDTVYRIASGRVGGKTRASYSGAYVIQEFKISCDYVTGNGLDMFAHMILDDGRPATSYKIFSSNNIGKTVFLTREEAEKALKGV